MEEKIGNERISPQLVREFQLQDWQVKNVLELIDEGNTIPFIARYRKEMTGAMSDEVLRDFHERLMYLRNLEARKDSVLASIAEQEKLTPELEQKIRNAATMVEVEDLYRPYRPKRRTRATIAKEKGLEPLAMLLWNQEEDTEAELLAQAYVDEEKGVATPQEALAGAGDILAELIADNAEWRKYIRETTAKNGTLRAKAKDPEAESVYEMYYDYEEPIRKLAGHQILALNRGEAEKMLPAREPGSAGGWNRRLSGTEDHSVGIAAELSAGGNSRCV